MTVPLSTSVRQDFMLEHHKTISSTSYEVHVTKMPVTEMGEVNVEPRPRLESRQ